MLLIFEKREANEDNKYFRQFPTIHDYLGFDIDLNDQEQVEDAITNRGYDPTLMKARLEFFCNLQPEMITNVELVEEYTDDHEPCVDVHISFNTGDVLSVACMWTNLTGAFQYWEDSARARQDIAEYFNWYSDPENL